MLGVIQSQAVPRGNSTACRVPPVSFLRHGNRQILTRLIPLALLALTACRPHDFPQYPANYREYAYITNSASNTVTVLDVVNIRVDRELAVGADPLAIAASPTRNEIYVVNSGTATTQGSLSIIDAEHNVDVVLGMK